MKGRIWTWANNRKGESFIEERLDMFFGYAEWLLDFYKEVVQHILIQVSDHSILLLDSMPHKLNRRSRFIFDNRWCKMESCAEMVKSCWKQEVEVSRMYQFNKKLKLCRQGVLEWRKKESSNSKIQIENIKRKMESM